MSVKKVKKSVSKNKKKITSKKALKKVIKKVVKKTVKTLGKKKPVKKSVVKKKALAKKKLTTKKKVLAKKPVVKKAVKTLGKKKPVKKPVVKKKALAKKKITTKKKVLAKKPVVKKAVKTLGKKKPVKKTVVNKIASGSVKKTPLSKNSKLTKGSEKSSHQSVTKSMTSDKPAAFEVWGFVANLSSDKFVLKNEKGEPYCRYDKCNDIATVDSYCRYHYLFFWNTICNRRKLLEEGSLKKVVEDIVVDLSPKTYQMLAEHMQSDSDFLDAVNEFDLVDLKEEAFEDQFSDDSVDPHYDFS